MNDENTTSTSHERMTVADLRQLIEDVPGDTLVLISEYDDREQDWVRVPVIAGEMRSGFNATPMLVLASDDPQHALK